jgi:hypothetical protein
MDIDVEIAENSERKVRSIFMGTCCTILVLLISVSYGMVWGILFLVWTGREVYDPSCEILVSWDRALYIVQFISAGLHLVSTIFQLISIGYDKESNIPKYIMGCRSCIMFMAGLAILIGINISYFKHDDISLCENLAGLNLAYIITEWTILGSCICFVCILCSISIILKKRKR